jgi:DNA polymerase-3 subunit epsilon
MRQIILDTETTGLSWEKGNRIVEIGCVEYLDRRPTGRTFHKYLNPEREMEPGAAEVTGLTFDFLSDKPLFVEVADEFLRFIEGAELVIHNAEFDVGFLDAELRRLDRPSPGIAVLCSVLDTLKLARELYPGQRNSLDALCKRLGVDNGHRQRHGALLDAELLADVYLAMTSGQTGFGFDPAPVAEVQSMPVDKTLIGVKTVILTASDEEQEAHALRMDKIIKVSGKLLWKT